MVRCSCSTKSLGKRLNMNTSFTYGFEKYKTRQQSKHTCPACGVKHVFVRYVDQDGNYLADQVGRCDRESKCGYHLTPYQYFQDNPQNRPAAAIQPLKQAIPEPAKVIEYVSPEVLRATLKAYDKNTFVQYLGTLFDPETVQWLIDLYGIGTARDGGCIFWQVDDQGRIRTGKVIQYGSDGHRDKSLPPYFIHGKLGIKNIEQCLFGLHLLMIDDTRPIGLVESEKTAIVMAGKLHSYFWMATGAKLNLKTVHALRGKKVVAFPDGDGFTDWKERLAPYGFEVSSALQKYLTADEQSEGKDLADFVPSLNKN